MATSCVRYGPNVTAELGKDMRAMGASRVMLVTDPTVAQLQPVKTALDALSKAGLAGKTAPLADEKRGVACVCAVYVCVCVCVCVLCVLCVCVLCVDAKPAVECGR